MITYKQVEAMLYSYIRETAVLRDLHLELEYLEIEAGIRGITYEERIKTGTGSNEVERAYIKYEKEHTRIRLQLTKIEKKLRKTESAIKALTEEEQTIIKAFYFYGKQWYRIGFEVHKAISTCKNIRRRAIEKLVEILEENQDENWTKSGR